MHRWGEWRVFTRIHACKLSAIRHTATLPTAYGHPASVPKQYQYRAYMSLSRCHVQTRDRRACSQLARFARKRNCIYIAVCCCATVDCRQRFVISRWRDQRSTAESAHSRLHPEKGGGTMRQTMAKRRRSRSSCQQSRLFITRNLPLPAQAHTHTSPRGPGPGPGHRSCPRVKQSDPNNERPKRQQTPLCKNTEMGAE